MMRFLSVLFSLLVIGSGANHLHAQAWVNVGSPGFFTNPSDAAIAVYNNTPYIVGKNEAQVMKFDSTAWVNVGAPVVPWYGSAKTSMAIDKDGVPYVIYVNYDDGQKATVAKYNGSSWVTVGSAGFTGNPVTNTVIAIDTAGTPYVAYTDYGHAQAVTVMKFNGTSWVTVGSPGFSAGASAYVSLAITKAGTPYVAYQDIANNSRATAMKYNGSSWVTVGSPAFSDSSADYTSIAIDTAGIPYVAYSDVMDAGFATVKRYVGGSWETVDYTGFSGVPVEWTSIAIDKNNKIYLAYLQPFMPTPMTAGMGVTVMTYDGFWFPVGEVGFAAGDNIHSAMALDDNGTPYILYNGITYLSVAKLDTALAPITGSHNICAGTTATLSELKGGGTWSSSDTTVATIDSFGVVTAISWGLATASYTKGGSSTTFAIYVDTLPVVRFNTYGIDSTCVGLSVFVFPEVYGAWSSITATGTWINLDPTIAGITEYATYARLEGISIGSASLKFIATNVCGTDTTSYSFRIGACREGINDLRNSSGSSVYPNPGTGKLTISSSGSINTISINNLLGQTVYTRECNSTLIDVDISPLLPGIYIIRINNTEVHRFQKE